MERMPPGLLVDRYGRAMVYLRFSLTEACNLSCQYCLPEGYPEWYRHKARLKDSDITTILMGFQTLGFRKVRFTGGEPTVHPGCLRAVATASDLGYETIALTTNGLLMPDIGPWQRAGLTQINISLDTLDSERFSQMTRGRGHERILALVEQAIAAGLVVKINTVLLRSQNGSEIDELIEWAIARPLTLRFIELMPTKLNRSFYEQEQVLGSEIVPRLQRLGLVMEDVATTSQDINLRGPATVYSSPAYAGKVGLINPLSCNFCHACNRLRVTAKGRLKLCLFGDHDLPLDLTSAETIAQDVYRLIAQKGERHELETGHVGNVATFRTIGG